MSLLRLIKLGLPLLLLVGAPASRAEDADAAELQRELEREMASDRALEREGLLERNRNVACVPNQSDLFALGKDIMLHGKLARSDFLATRNMSTERDYAVHIPGAEVGAHVGLLVACVRGELRLEQRPDGLWEAWIDDIRYYALLDRSRSWWNPRAKIHPEWILRHEQLHFDLAELVVRRHNTTNEAGRNAAAVGATDHEALEASDRLWMERLDSLWAEFREIEHRYDLETRHGNVASEQTRWFEQTLRELAATQDVVNR